MLIAVKTLLYWLFLRANPVLGFSLDHTMDLGFEDNNNVEVARYCSESQYLSSTVV